MGVPNLHLHLDLFRKPVQNLDWFGVFGPEPGPAHCPAFEIQFSGPGPGPAMSVNKTRRELLH